MKRYNNLLPLIAEKDNLYTAYWRAKQGKEAKHEVVRYGQRLEENLLLLKKQIMDGAVDVGHYRYFTIFDPKERVICAAPFSQRVLHHALMNVCGPLLDKRQVLDSYASQKGKGTYAALERARYFHRKYAWCIKMDVRKYFDSIHHDVLKRQLASFFKEPKLLRILFDIIDSYDSGTAERGLPIGNLSSQYLANHYLAGLDHYAYEQVGVEGYVRYMDDILMYGNTKEELISQAQRLRKYLKDVLQLELKVFDIKPTSKNSQFLGYRLTNHTMTLSQRSMKRFRHRMKQYQALWECGLWDDDEYRRHLSPLVSFVLKADSYKYRKLIMQTIEKRAAS